MTGVAMTLGETLVTALQVACGLAIITVSGWVLVPRVRRRIVEYFVDARVAAGLGADRIGQSIAAFLSAICLAAFGFVLVYGAFRSYFVLKK